jgi:hypothetical protein
VRPDIDIFGAVLVLSLLPGTMAAQTPAQPVDDAALACAGRPLGFVPPRAHDS